MAKHQNLSAYQQKIVKRYYEHADSITIQKLQELVSELYLAEGKSAKEIGAILNISPRTVETHKYKMMDDLGVSTAAQLVQHAIKHGLVTPT